MKLQEAVVAPMEITVEPLPQPADKASWEAALASAREAGYRQGFQDGFLANYKMQNGMTPGATSATASSPAETEEKELSPTGKVLVGLPCSKCGRSYASTLKICPRCKTPAEVPGSSA
jgi:hypothetical protein